jgi:hypothetical protein
LLLSRVYKQHIITSAWKSPTPIIFSERIGTLGATRLTYFEHIDHVLIDRCAVFGVWLQNLSGHMVRALAAALASPSKTQIMALHSTLLELRQHPDETMKTCLQWVQKYGDKLTTVGKSFDPTDFNLYLLKGLRFKFLKILSQH